MTYLCVMSFKSPTTYSISKKFAIFQGFTDAKLTKKFIAPEFNYTYISEQLDVPLKLINDEINSLKLELK